MDLEHFYTRATICENKRILNFDLDPLTYGLKPMYQNLNTTLIDKKRSDNLIFGQGIFRVSSLIWLSRSGCPK